MSESNNAIESPVLRVTQLDTSELNDTILLNIKQSINEDYFKYIQFNIFQKYHVEIYAALKFVLWYHTYGKRNQTVSQSLLNWSYSDQNLTKLKKISHCLIFCLDDWFQEKFIHLIKKLYRFILSKKTDQTNSTEQKLKQIEKYFNYLNVLYKLASFLNYIAFLFNGKYLNLWERLLNLRPVYKQQQFMSQQLNLETSIREEMWYSCFTLFKLSDSLFNFSKLKKKYLTTEQTSDTSLLANKYICSICNKEPTVAHIDAMRSSSTKDSISTPCQHIFCYYCIQKELFDNKQYHCSICNKQINEIELYYKN